MMQRGELSTDGKAYLVGLVGSLAGRRITIKSGRVVIGRDATQCDIHLDQAVISRLHAALETDEHNQVTIVDLNSRQGTFVNDELVTRRQLRDGDRIGLGLGGIVAFTFHAAAQYPEQPFVAEAAHAYAPVAQREASPFSGPTAFGGNPVDYAPKAATMMLRAAQIPVLRLGRAPDNNIILDAPSVSRYHAALTYVDGGQQPTITDLGSTNGTFVNGEPVTEPRPLSPHDLVFIGGFLLNIEGRSIRQHDLSASRITATSIVKEIENKTILKDISLAIYPREFVGLMGPSGCGKSTLMDALNGLRPATSGAVYVNDLDLYSNFDALRRSIGYVPQRDVLHDALTVERTLHYTAKLRLPEGTPPELMQQVIEEVIQTVGLTEQRDTAFRQLSGGQQKRLSLALELITKPNFIFLDEPTSPLDPETTENMMMLFRRLADEGRIIVMVTHKFEKFAEMHHIAMLTRGGRLAYFGPPREALSYFGCREPSDIYRLIGSQDPDQLSEAYKASPQCQRYINARIAETQELTRSTGQLSVAGAASQQEGPDRRFGFRQWLTLTERYLEVKLKDKRNSILLLAQAPVIAIILAIITGDSLNDPKAIFISAIIAIWFGANNAVREIVTEIPIYTRERLVNLKIPSYVMSKFAVLSGIGLIQCLLFISILVFAGRFSASDVLQLTLILYLTLLAGISIGLFFSALVNSSEKAMSILPLILIPQLLLGGFLKPLDDIYVNLNTKKPATEAQYRRAKTAQEQQSGSSTSMMRQMPVTAPEIIEKSSDGLGAVRFTSDLMVARWAIEGLAHQVSIRDEKARDNLPTNMTVAAYQRVFDGYSEREITSAYRKRVVLDLFVLGLFSLIFLSLTMWALKRKDVL